ncbi:MAG TPA: glycine--tRNA ligase [Firmicutes bacterium]|nr:glycine--tRNA ligase [Bacillota bacterium]
MQKFSFDKITTHLISSGFVYPGSELYGGLANSWDFGPLGTLVKNHLKEAFRQHFIRENEYIVEIEPAIIMNPKVWEATGHVANFHDPLVDCKYCHSRYRADDLISSQHPDICCDGKSVEELNTLMVEKNITCPTCGKSSFTPIRQFQMMFKTFMGVTEEKSSVVYLRPETAQGIFVNFKNVMRTSRGKLPIGICDMGKAFRNEITPGNFIFRTREFEQMEIEFFCSPDEDLKWFEYFKKDCMSFVQSIGLSSENLRYRDHAKEELAFYSKATTDIEYLYPFGWGELMGIASRTNYDLNRHQESSGNDLTYLDPVTNERYIPHVVEPSFGCERLMLALLCQSYDEEELEKDTRIVMHFDPRIAPYSVAVLPLSKQLSDKAFEVYKNLSRHYDATFDTTGSIGKRYRREDAIGTPLCITVDFDTLEDNAVTVRDRDTMKQERIKLDELNKYLEEKLGFSRSYR